MHCKKERRTKRRWGEAQKTEKERGKTEEQGIQPMINELQCYPNIFSVHHNYKVSLSVSPNQPRGPSQLEGYLKSG